MSAQIPVSYISKEDLRLEAYRKLAICEELDNVLKIQDEWTDRFGPVPVAAENLLSVAKLRCVARKLGVNEIAGRRLHQHEGSQWVAKLSPINLRPSEVVSVKRLYPGSLFKESISELQIVFDHSTTPVQDLVSYLQGVLSPSRVLSPESFD